MPTIIALAVAFLLGVFGVFWAKDKPAPVALGVTALWSLIAGLFTGPAMANYVEVLGAATVLQCCLGTAAVMAICGVVAAFNSIDFSNPKFGGFLMIGLLGLIAAGLINIFVSFGHFGTLLYSGIGMLLFVGYFLFDFHQLIIKSTDSDDTWGFAIWASVGLYLDFMNFLLDLLRFVAESKK